jgi:hypothetical protein
MASDLRNAVDQYLGWQAMISFECFSAISVANPLRKTLVLDQADLATLSNP